MNPLRDVSGTMSKEAGHCLGDPLHFLTLFCDFVVCQGIQTESVLSARLQIIRIYIREDGRLVIEFKTHAKFRGSFCVVFFPLLLYLKIF